SMSLLWAKSRPAFARRRPDRTLLNGRLRAQSRRGWDGEDAEGAGETRPAPAGRAARPPACLLQCRSRMPRGSVPVSIINHQLLSAPRWFAIHAEVGAKRLSDMAKT